MSRANAVGEDFFTGKMFRKKKIGGAEVRTKRTKERLRAGANSKTKEKMEENFMNNANCNTESNTVYWRTFKGKKRRHRERERFFHSAGKMRFLKRKLSTENLQ